MKKKIYFLLSAFFISTASFAIVQNNNSQKNEASPTYSITLHAGYYNPKFDITINSPTPITAISFYDGANLSDQLNAWDQLGPNNFTITTNGTNIGGENGLASYTATPIKTGSFYNKNSITIQSIPLLDMAEISVPGKNMPFNGEQSLIVGNLKSWLFHL